MRIKKLSRDAFVVRARRKRMRVIEIVPQQIVTRELVIEPLIRDGVVVPDTSRDVLKLVVVERHKKTGRIGIGFVKGFGLKRGALASSVAHDSHNIIAVGTNDVDIACAVNALVNHGGGFVAADADKPVAALPLPIAGLMSDAPAPVVAGEYTKLHQAAQRLGCTTKEPFLQLSFLALPVLPSLKLTDFGLIDATSLRKTSLFV